MERQEDRARLENMNQLLIRLGANLGGMMFAMQEDIRVLTRWLSPDGYIAQQLRQQGNRINSMQTRQSGVVERQFGILQLANRMDRRVATMYWDHLHQGGGQGGIGVDRQVMGGGNGPPDVGGHQPDDGPVVQERNLSPEYHPALGTDDDGRSSSPDYNPPEPVEQERESTLEYVVSDEEINNNEE